MMFGASCWCFLAEYTRWVEVYLTMYLRRLGREGSSQQVRTVVGKMVGYLRRI